jgi:hypothetical protein
VKHDAEYNPLDYANLTNHVVDELMRRGPYEFPVVDPFLGAGVYALFYKGPLEIYAKIRSPDATWPIYVGKAVPPGGRKGGPRASLKHTRALFNRLSKHAASIRATTSKEGGRYALGIDDFVCRYLVVTPIWITMAERLLIEAYRPVWNRCLDGFGNNPPGKNRPGVISFWDALHKGRPWADRLKQSRKQKDSLKKLEGFLRDYKCERAAVSLEQLETVEPDDGE